MSTYRVKEPYLRSFEQDGNQAIAGQAKIPSQTCACDPYDTYMQIKPNV